MHSVIIKMLNVVYVTGNLCAHLDNNLKISSFVSLQCKKWDGSFGDMNLSSRSTYRGEEARGPYPISIRVLIKAPLSQTCYQRIAVRQDCM